MSVKCPLASDVNFEAITHSEPKKSMGGVGVAFCYARKSKTDRSDVEFQLTKPEPELMRDDTPARVREEKLAQLPSIRSGFHLQSNPQFEANGKHTLLISVAEDVAATVRALDESNVNEVVANAQSWFKRGNLPADLVRAQYNTLVYRYPDNAEVAESEKCTVIRCKIIEGKTQVLVQTSDNYKKFQHGDLRDLQMNARVIPILKDKGIYFRSTESGGQLSVEKILVMHGDWKPNAKTFDLGDIDIEIEQDFVPPTSIPIAAAAAAGGMDIDAGGATEQTVVNGGTWANTDQGQGPAVLF